MPLSILKCFLLISAVDIEAIKDFVEYTHKCAYNAELKASNVVVLLNPYRSNTGGVIEFRKDVANRPLGDALYSKVIMSISKEVIVENAKFFQSVSRF